MIVKRLFVGVMLLVFFQIANAQKINIDSFIANQPDSMLVVAKVEIAGNKITKPFIILRELALKQGDLINKKNLKALLLLSRNQLFNTELFVDDSVYVSSAVGYFIQIQVQVKERWYFFPLPYIKPIDRNINQWLFQQGASLSRVDYGIKLMETNLTGRNDKLNVWLINGYNQQVSLRYDIPFIDKKLKHGINVGFGYSRQHELNYATSYNNLQLFLKLPDKYAREIRRFDATYSYRPDQRTRHYIRFGYYDENIDDSIFKVNPTYYPNGLKRVQYASIAYSYNYYNTDYNYFPTKGYIINASITKKGFDKVVDMWILQLHGTYAYPFSLKTFLLLDGSATVKFPKNPYFFNQSLFGSGSMQLSGQEYNVVDGMYGGVIKANLYHKIWQYIFKPPVKTKSHDVIPFKFYLKMFANVGYAQNPFQQTKLNNTLMYTYGVGLDIVTAYDFVIKIDFAFNQLGVNGLYFHTRNDF